MHNRPPREHGTNGGGWRGRDSRRYSDQSEAAALGRRRWLLPVSLDEAAARDATQNLENKQRLQEAVTT